MTSRQLESLFAKDRAKYIKSGFISKLSKIFSSRLPKYSINRMKYKSSKPLESIQIDTMFYKNHYMTLEYTFLVIVDVNTRYVSIYPQKRKNEKINEAVKEFVKNVEKKFGKDNCSKDIVIVSDDAKELKILRDLKMNNHSIRHHVSRSIFKAAIAESMIGIIKRMITKLIVEIDMLNFEEDEDVIVDEKMLLEIVKFIEDEINDKSEIREMNIQNIDYSFNSFEVGNAVFLKNYHKYSTQHNQFKKKSTAVNYYYEPFVIVNIIHWDGLYKYELMSLETNEILKYQAYPEELKLIPYDLVEDYLKYYLNRSEKDTFKPNTVKL